MTKIDQEDIYRLLEEKNWKSIIRQFHDHKDLIKSDPMLSHALTITLQEIAQRSKDLVVDSDFAESLEQIIMLNINGHISLSDVQLESIVLAIIGEHKENPSYCYNYAKLCPENPECNSIIELHEKDAPQTLAHSRQDLITAQTQNANANNDHRKDLFNSPQETEFYLALKRVFPTYQIYPNVSLSCIFRFEDIKSELALREQEYFFRSSIDFVVFEPFKNYLPVYFFELDSTYHDSNEQKEKDSIKDRICGICGQKLIRIRKNDPSVNEDDFESFLYDIREQLKRSER